MATLRPATEADLTFLLELRRESMSPHFAEAGLEWDEVFHRARVLHRYDCAMIVEDHGKPIGLLKVDRETDPWELVQIQLDAEHRGRGLGTALIAQVTREADAAGMGLSLKVLPENPARRLYERSGFQVVRPIGRGLLMVRR